MTDRRRLAPIDEAADAGLVFGVPDFLPLGDGWAAGPAFMRERSPSQARPRGHGEAHRGHSGGSDAPLAARLCYLRASAGRPECARRAWRPRTLPPCRASRCRSLLSFLSSFSSAAFTHGQSRKRIDMRSSRARFASSSCPGSSVDRFVGRSAITPCPAASRRASGRAPATCGSSRPNYASPASAAPHFRRSWRDGQGGQSGRSGDGTAIVAALCECHFVEITTPTCGRRPVTRGLAR